jgi:hypothetical protein
LDSMAIDKLFKLRMYAEVRFSYKDSVDPLAELKELTRNTFDCEEVTSDELVLKQKEPVPESWEIRIKPRRLIFTMDSCPSYDFFVSILETTMDTVSSVITPQEVLNIGVQGYYMYSINSLEDFSEVVSSWSQSYTTIGSDSVGISDIGVNVFFKEDTLSVNILCNFLSRDQAARFFPHDDPCLISDLNLFININISTGDILELKKVLSPKLVMAIKTHINQATKKLEEKIEGMIKSAR